MSAQGKFVFKRINYFILFAGIALLVLGFITMTLETEEYGFGALGLTVGPLLLMAGFLVQFVAIFYKPKN